MSKRNEIVEREEVIFTKLSARPLYKRAEHWPPYTYRDYPDVTPENLRLFTNFLEIKNTSYKKKELQPWIPFCDSRCTFCYFPTEPYAIDEVERYLLALEKALKMYAETVYVRSSEFDEIYFGGGSPSVMSSKQIADLLSVCERDFSISDNRSVKVTGCTHNFDEKKLERVSKRGVDQLDLGVQTFENNIRKVLNLRDSADKAEQTIKTAGKQGLRVSIDLIYNLPGQTMDVWRKDVQKALELDVESVDCYPLDVRPGTLLFKQLQSGEVPYIGGSDTERKMYLEAYGLFEESGYKPTCHNRFSRIAEDFTEPCSEILGTGSGFFMGHLGKYSYVDMKPVNAYIDLVRRGSFPLTKLSLSSEEDEMKKMMTRLYIRLSVNKEEFRKRFGSLPEEVFATVIKELKDKGLIEVDDQEIRLTKLGDVWRVNIAWEFARAQYVI